MIDISNHRSKTGAYYKVSFFLFFLYLLSPEYIVGRFYVQDIIAITCFFSWVLLGGLKVSIPRVFVFLLAVPLVHLLFFGLFYPHGFFSEVQSFGREFFIIFLSISFSHALLSKRVSNFILLVILIFLVVDFLQSIRVYYFHNFAMQQYYDSIDLILYLPRYVYYRDHISFTPLIVFLTTLALHSFSNRWRVMGVLSILYVLILQSRTYIFYLFSRFFLQSKNKFFIATVSLSFFIIVLLLYFIGWFSGVEGDFGGKLTRVFSSDGMAVLASDIMLRVDNWLAWINMLIDEFLFLGIGAFGISNKSDFITLTKVYAIDNIFVREFVRYGVFGFIKIAIIFAIFMKSFDKNIPEKYNNFVVFVRYIVIACLVNDLLSNVIVRACFYTSVAIMYQSTVLSIKDKKVST